MERREERVNSVTSAQQQRGNIHNSPLQEFSEEIKRCCYYFFEQMIAHGLGPDEQGYRLLMSITRRVVLYPDENNQSLLNCDLEKFVLGLSHARSESQKDLLKLLLELLPPYYQSLVINIILFYEDRYKPDTFMRDSSFGGQLAIAVTEIEGDYIPYLDELSELQKLVERHIDEFKKELKTNTLEKLIQRMNRELDTIITSIDVVPPLIKIVCKHIAKVSPSEDIGLQRIAGFFINRYLGGVIIKRNEALFSKTDTGEVVKTSIILYMLKFLQSLATTTESEKLTHLDSPFVETITPENREKLLIFLKSLCQCNLKVEEPAKLQINYDWSRLSRVESDITFRARFYTIYSLYHQFRMSQSSTPRLLVRSDSKGAIRGRRPTFNVMRSSSFTDFKVFLSKKQIDINTTDPLKGLSILELMNELINDSTVSLFHDAFSLCADFVFYHLEKLCRQPNANVEEVQKISNWSPRSHFRNTQGKQDEGRQIILSNISTYLTHISDIAQIQLGITYLIYHMSRVNTKESNGDIYEKLYRNLIEVAFIREKESTLRTFEDLVNCISHWIKGHPDRQKDVVAKSILLGEFLVRKHLHSEAFKSLFFQEIDLAINGEASLTSELK